MSGPLDPAAAGRGQFRASQADREQVIELLKAAYVQDRLTKDELDMRVGQALASRTYAELAALTADIPAGPAAAPLQRQPARTPPNRTPRKRGPRSRTARDVAIGSGIGLSLAAAIVLSGLLSAVALLGLLALPIVVVALLLIVASASSQRRSRGQLPPRPGPGGHAPGIQQPGQAGRDPGPPPDRPDQARADLQMHRSRPRRRQHFGLGTRAVRPAGYAVPSES